MKISVITISKNEKNSIEKTILSVINQTSFKNIEYIVIDGGSDDGTVQILNNYKDKFAYCISQPDSGIYCAFNKGIKHSSGDYLLFLNAGDRLYSEDTIEKTMQHLQNSNEDLIYGDLISHTKQIRYKVTDKYFLFYKSLPHPSTFFKKQIFDKTGFYNENFKIAGDYEWFMRYFMEHNGRCRHINEFISVFDINGISLQTKYNKIHMAERQTVKDKYYSRFEKIFFKALKKLDDLNMPVFNTLRKVKINKIYS